MQENPKAENIEKPMEKHKFWKPRGPQDCPKMTPRWPQVGPKMTPRWPKMAQDGPKTAPRCNIRARRHNKNEKDRFALVFTMLYTNFKINLPGNETESEG